MNMKKIIGLAATLYLGSFLIALEQAQAQQDTVTQKSAAEYVTELASLDQLKELFSIAQEKLLIIDVYGTYCGPCKKMAPIFDKLAQDYDSQVLFAKLDVESATLDSDALVALLQTTEIKSVPTLLLVKSGKLVARSAGSKNAEALKKLIEDNK